MGPLPKESGGYRNNPTATPATPGETMPDLPPVPDLPSGSIDVDTDVVRRAAAGFTGDANTAANIVTSLTGTLDGNSAGGEPWGDDSVGATFGAVYAPARDSGLRALNNFYALLESVASRLSANAGNHEATENTNQHLVRTLDRRTR